MKKLISLLGLSLCGLAASAQPTSFGGITPGTTTREELKSLVQKTGAVGTKNDVTVNLKQPEGQYVVVMLQNDVVYEVWVYLSEYSPGLERALIEKYGQPKIKVGAIRTVTCQNKFGASFERLSGQETLLWPVKDGVQGEIDRLASGCSDHPMYERYLLRHVATVAAVKEKQAEEARGEAEKQRSKFEGAL